MKALRKALVPVVAAVLLASGCASSVGFEGPPGITVLVTASPSTSALRSAATEYTAETGVPVNFVQSPYQQLPTKVLLAEQAGDATFDVAMVDAVHLATLAPSGALSPIDSYLADDARYDNADVPRELQEYAQYKGTSYGVPLTTEPFLFYYRTNLYERVDLRPPTTWEQFGRDLPIFQRDEVYGAATIYGPQLASKGFAEFVYSSGARLFDPRTNEPLLDTPLLRDLMNDYLSFQPYSPESANSGGHTEATTAFSQLDVASVTAPAGWYPVMADESKSKAADKFTAVVPPTSEKGPYPAQHLLYGWLLGISGLSEHKDQAWDFISFALSPANTQRFLDAGATPPARLSTTSNPDYVRQAPYLPQVEAGVRQGTYLPRWPEMTEVMLVFSQGISRIASGQASVDEGMQDTNDKVRSILVRYGRVGAQ